MKKIMSVALIATSMFLQNNSAKAQEGLQLGVEGTPQLSWLLNKDDKDNDKYKSMTTFNGAFGINSQYGFNENLGIGLNVLYSFQGQRYKWNEIENIRKVEYVKIPLLFVYTTEISPNLMFIGKIGPQLGLLTNAKLCDKDGNTIISNQKSAYEDFDFGAMANAGVGIMLTEQWYLDAMLRYDYGFTDAEDKDYLQNFNSPTGTTNGNGTTNRDKTFNSTAGITIGLRYLFQ